MSPERTLLQTAPELRGRLRDRLQGERSQVPTLSAQASVLSGLGPPSGPDLHGNPEGRAPHSRLSPPDLAEVTLINCSECRAVL